MKQTGGKPSTSDFLDIRSPMFPKLAGTAATSAQANCGPPRRSAFAPGRDLYFFYCVLAPSSEQMLSFFQSVLCFFACAVLAIDEKSCTPTTVVFVERAANWN
jgi:hypothetical protein